MKRVFSMVFLSVFLFMAGKSQQPVRKGTVETVTISVPTVQCEQCKDRIEKYLTREDGVLTVKVDYKKKTCKVTYLWDRTNTENIKTAIANTGYDAGDVTADPEAYKKLPPCCKKPETGTDIKKSN